MYPICIIQKVHKQIKDGTLKTFAWLFNHTGTESGHGMPWSGTVMDGVQ